MPNNPVLAFVGTTFIVGALVIMYFIGGLILGTLSGQVNGVIVNIPFLAADSLKIAAFWAQIITMFGVCIVIALLGCGVYLLVYSWRQEPATPGYGY